MKNKIILGSASPRRKELLRQIGIDFQVRVSEKEEIYHSETPEDIVKELSLMKARNVADDLISQNGPITDTIILGADTVVVLDRQILGKPKDEEDAFLMLQSLQGRAHNVYTGVAVLRYDNAGNRTVINRAIGTAVYVNPMTEGEIRKYISTGECMDKAGAYGIQGRFAPFISRIDGDYYNVVGLPVSYVYQVLRELGAI